MKLLKSILILTVLLTAPVLAMGAGVDQLLAQAQKHIQQGDFESALPKLSNAAELQQSTGDVRGESQSRAQLAEVAQALGQNEAALEQLEHARGLAEQAEDPAWHAALLGTLGGAYTRAGLYEQAEQSLYEGLQLAKNNHANRVEASLLNNLGNLRSAQGNESEAIGYLLESQRKAQQAGSHGLAARASLNVADLLLDAGRFQDATRSLDIAADETRQLADSHDKTFLLIRNGRSLMRIGEQQPPLQSQTYPKAHALLTEAASQAEVINDKRAVSYAYGYLGGLYEDRQRYNEALQLTNKAVFAIQHLYAPEILYQWKWQAGRILKARGNNKDAIAAYRQSVDSIQAIRAELDTGSADVAASFRKDAAPVFLELADLLFIDSESSEDPQRVQASLVEARETVELLKAAEIQDYFQDDCVAAVRERIKDLDETLGSGTAVLYPIVFEDRIELLLSLPSGLTRTSVPIGREQLVAEVNAFRRNLEKRTTRQYLRQARALYSWIISPLEKELKNNNTRVLVLVPDSSLRTIPLSALHDGKDFLVQHYAVATTPSMRLTDPRPIDRTNVTLLLNGLSVQRDDFPALLNVTTELDSIEAMYGGKKLQNEDFRKDRLQEELTQNEYSIVHFATHGKFAGKVKDSFVLTYDGRMSMDELEQFVGISWFRQDNPVELLTLSACETAAGDDSAALGLASVAIKAGARSALASLWSINDEASSALVSDFYRELQDPAISKAEALQLAQLKLLDDLRYQHPVYWSPFLLIGNWL